jgi:hypothetical protein
VSPPQLVENALQRSRHLDTRPSAGLRRGLAEDDSQRLTAGHTVTHGQLRIVAPDRPRAHQDGVAVGADPVSVSALQPR